MKYVNGVIIIKNILESLVEYEQVPKGTSEVFLRLLDDLHYDKRKISEDSLNHFKEYYSYLFEVNTINKKLNKDE